MAAQWITRPFTWREDENGMWGWLPKGAPHFNASRDGLNLFHDAVEHHPDDDWSLAGEFQAFGAMLFFRKDCGFEYDDGRPVGYTPMAQRMGRDLVFFLHDAWYGIGSWDEVAPLGRHRRCTRLCLDDNLEDMIAEALAYTRAELPKELGEWNNPDTTALELPAYAALEQRIRHWLRIGHRRAERRWESVNGGAIWGLGYELCEEVQKQTKRLIAIVGDTGAAGARLSIRYCPRTAGLKVAVMLDGGIPPRQLLSAHTSSTATHNGALHA